MIHIAINNKRITIVIRKHKQIHQQNIVVWPIVLKMASGLHSDDVYWSSHANITYICGI